MIKVLIMINKFTIGGAETLVLNQVNALDKKRFDPYLGILYETSKEANLYSRLIIPKNRIVHFGFSGLFDPKAFYRLYSFTRKENFDVVIGNLFEANFAGRIAAIFAGVPVVFATEHSEYKGKSRWQIIADRLLAKKTDAVVAVSEEIADFTAKQENISRNKFWVLKQLVNFSVRNIFTRDDLRERLGIPLNALLSVTMGRFSPEKAQERVIEIADYLINKKNCRDIFFIIVGYGPREKELASLTEEKKLGRIVKIIADPKQAKEYLVAGDIFLLPSKREGVSLALLEAMGMGLVPIASKVGGMPEIIDDGVSGFLIPSGDTNRAAEILLWLNDHRDKIPVLKDNAVSAAKEKSGKIEDLQNLIEHFLSKS